MTRSRTIAVGTGGGATGWQTLAWAVTEAGTAGGRILVCHVCPPDSLLAASGAHPSLAVLELADPALSRAVATARNRLGAHRVELGVHTGPIGAALVRAARTADLLVVGAPHRSGWAERASTTHHVVRHAPCPVIVVRPVFDGRRRPFAGHVVVGVDGSEPSGAALELGFAFAEAHRWPLAAVHVTAREHEPAAGTVLLAEQVQPWQHKYPTVAVVRALPGGRPLPGLLRAADGANLLVVGDRGRGPAVRALLGSVSHGAVDRACCPVAIAHNRSGDMVPAAAAA